MKPQPSLFDVDAVDPSHNVRRTDPDTSRAAAYRHPEERRTGRVIARETIRAAGRDGLMDWQVQMLTGWPLNSINKRRGELRDQGLVVDSGRRGKTPTGSEAIIWIAVEFQR